MVCYSFGFSLRKKEEKTERGSSQSTSRLGKELQDAGSTRGGSKIPLGASLGAGIRREGALEGQAQGQELDISFPACLERAAPWKNSSFS